MNAEMEQLIEKLLNGDRAEAKQAKDTLKKELDKDLRLNWKSQEQAKKDRETFAKNTPEIYAKLFDSYETIKNHNKCSSLSFLSHALFYFKDNDEYFEKFLVHVREALNDKIDGNLRQIAVKTSSNSYATSTIGHLSLYSKNVSSKLKTSSLKFKDITLKHITEIFDNLEIIIEKDENGFPTTIEDMKPSVVKSHLLYIFEFDRFDVLAYVGGMYEEDLFFKDNESYKMWKIFYQNLLKAHPNIKKFIKNVPRYDLHKHDQEEDYGELEYDSSEIPKMIKDILDRPKEEGIPSSEFFFGGSGEGIIPGGFSIPEDSYFEISELIGDVDNKADLFEIFNLIYLKAWQAPVSEIYWYDLVDFVLSKFGDEKLRLRILKEVIKKLSSKIDINVPVNKDDKNNIHYGVHELRPIFRILAAYALCNDEHGDKKIAKKYYEFLLKLNPWDNQGIRYLLASLYAGKPASYVGELFDEGNKTHDWDKVEDFLNVQNAKHHFWSEPKE